MSKPLIPVPENLGAETGDKRSFRVLASGDATTIELFDDVYPWEAKRLLAEIKANKGKALDFRINSFGGDVFGGVAIYNALSKHEGAVNIEIEGVAASIASVIAMAGDRVRMGKGAFLMIHNPHAFSGGESQDLRATADLLDKVRNSLIDIYASRSGLKAEEIGEMMDAETWMDADDAVKMGFADALNGQAKIAAHADPSRFRNAPSVLLASGNPEPLSSPDAIRAAIESIEDRKVVRSIASWAGNRLKQLEAHADASDPPTPSPADEPETPADPPAPAAVDAPEDTPEQADPLVAEAVQARIRKLLGKSDEDQPGEGR